MLPRLVEADEREQPLGIVGIVVVRGEQLERLERLDPRVQATLLEHHAHARAQAHALTPRIHAEDAHLAGIGASVALEDLDRGGLARAVGTEEAEDLADRDRERDPVDRGGRAVALLERGDLDRVRRRVHRCGSLATAAWAGGFDE